MPSASERATLEAWMRASLAQAHDDLLHEPVPDDLLQLVARLAEQG